MHSICIFIILILNTYHIKDTTLNIEYNKNIELAHKIKNGQISLNHSIRAYQIANKINNKLFIAKSSKEISYDYENIGKLDSALFYAFKSVDFYKYLKLTERVAMMYNRISTLYFNQGDSILSVQYLNKALFIHRKIGEPIYIGEDLTNLGEMYRMMSHPEKALAYQREALQYIDKTEYKSQYAYTLGNLGLAYADLNEKDSADFYINESTKLLHELGDNYPITVYLSERAKSALKNGSYPEALEQVNKSLTMAQKENFKQQVADCYQLLSEIQQKTGNFEAALFAYQQARNLKDSISNIDLVREMERQRIDFEVSQHEATILSMKKVNTWRTAVILTLAVGLLFISGLFLYNRKLNQQLLTANNQLEEKSTELAIKNRTIEKSLEEKEVLLSEVHHRVKNNLQIISSLLNMQSRQLTDDRAISAFENSQRRLLTIASVHQQLCQSENMAVIHFPGYVTQLMDDIKRTYASTKPFECILNIDDVVFDLEKAMPLGLIINELATNSYKYAFNTIEHGVICIELKHHPTPDDQYELVYSDNGSGLPDDFSFDKTTSLGMRLIKILSKQLHGETSFSSATGFTFNLLF